MRWLSFFSKVAFVANLFFMLTVVLHFYPFVQEEGLVSTIVILGYFLAVFVFNPLIHILLLFAWLGKRKWRRVVPRWLLWTNFIFLVLQILYIILFLNDTRYN